MSRDHVLKFCTFEVNFIYGFRLKVVKGETDLFDKRFPRSPRRGWVPVYSAVHTPADVKQRPLHFYYDEEAESKDLDCIVEPDPQLWVRNRKLPGKISRHITLTPDGTGSITITLRFDSSDKRYTAGDILSCLMLIPRAFPKKEAPRWTRLKMEDGWQFATDKNPFRTCEAPISDIFMIFAESMLAFEKYYDGAIEWDECVSHHEDGTTAGNCSMYCIERLATDPQIPYMYVRGSMRPSTYKKCFLENVELNNGSYPGDRSFSDLFGLGPSRTSRDNRIGKEIGAILGRWVSDKNIDFVSEDYWRKLGVLDEEGRPYSGYMNSLIFTAFSNFLALNIHPHVDDDLIESNPALETVRMPIKPTTTSILRCLELVKMRWHFAIWLNLRIDGLIEKTMKIETSQDMIEPFEELANVRTCVAQHLENPLLYVWDAEVGNQIAEFLQERIIKKLERGTIEKLSITEQILTTKKDRARSRDFARMVEIQEKSELK